MRKADLEIRLGSFVKVTFLDGKEDCGVLRKSNEKGIYELEKWSPEEEKVKFRASHAKRCKITC